MAEEFAERKQVFSGIIRKCPNCGTQITTDITKCPSCGFVIEKESVSAAMEEFANKFVSFYNDAEKKDFVETYPIPNNKNDIRGFLNYATSQRDKDYATSKEKVFWVTAWNNKCRSIVNQAFDVFGADSEFIDYLRNYKKEVEKSSKEIKKIKNKLLFGKIAKFFVAAVLVLCIIEVSTIKSKKRAELVAGCVVPKENVSIQGGWFDIISDADIKTVSITNRVATDSDEPVWCLDTLVIVEVKPHDDFYNSNLNKVKKIFPNFYNSPDFSGNVWFRTNGDEENIDCSYQSQSVTKHGFDNVHQISETLLSIKDFEKVKDKPIKLEIRLTQIAGSKSECESLAIQLHESRNFSFEIKGFYEEFLKQWNLRQQQ